MLARRSRILELYSQGLTERKISLALNIPRSTIGVDIRVLRRTVIKNIKDFEERLAFEHESLMVGISAVLERAWNILNCVSNLDTA